MKKLYTFLLLAIPFLLGAQNPNIHHWEIIQGFYNDLYFTVGAEAPPADWNTLEFNDETWNKTNYNVVGYGTPFDELKGFLNDIILYNTPQTTTIYTRSYFNVSDTSVVEDIMLELYYTDGIIAYINGVEVARDNIGNPDEAVTYDQPADTTQPNMGDIYYGFFAPGFRVYKEKLLTCLKPGNNVLALELHNDIHKPEDHNFFGWISIGLRNEGMQYLGTDLYSPNDVILENSNLPIVTINTLDSLIPDEPKTTAKMQVVFDESGGMNAVSSTTFNYDGYIGIELRGSSTMMAPKKSFTIETRDSLGENLNVSLLGMPEENDWVLYASYFDKTLMRNKITYDISNDIGLYAPRARFVELIINEKLMGTYVLMEKIKRDKNRVNVSKLRPDEIAGDSLTGGYILKIDKTEDGPDGWSSEFGSADKESHRTFFQYVYPKPDEIVDEQKIYIQTFMESFEKSLRKDNFEDQEEGYRSFINVESFIDFFIMNEFTRNLDGYRLSTYMYKDRDDKDGRLHMGPLWDFNLALGNYEYFNGHLVEGWALDFGKDMPSDRYQLPFWWDRLLQDPAFVTQLQNRWNYLREHDLHKDSIFNRIDGMVDKIEEAQIRNAAVWPGLFTEDIWVISPLADDYAGEISFMKNWISGRLAWVDANIGEIRDKVDYVSIENEAFNEFIGVKAYPNPFTDYVVISLELQAEHNVNIEIYNTIGQRVATIENTTLNEGNYEYQWNGVTENGSNAKAGIYIYTVNIDNKRAYTGKILKQ